MSVASRERQRLRDQREGRCRPPSDPPKHWRCLECKTIFKATQAEIDEGIRSHTHVHLAEHGEKSE